VWKDATGAVVRVAAGNEVGSVSVVDSNGRVWPTAQTGRSIVATRFHVYSGAGCTGTEYSMQLVARVPFALEDEPTQIRVLADKA
jgi:hypothetical protein